MVDTVVMIYRVSSVYPLLQINVSIMARLGKYEWKIIQIYQTCIQYHPVERYSKYSVIIFKMEGMQKKSREKSRVKEMRLKKSR